MEFATENYLNELLLNTEANGFESAKEAFYECIANEGKLSDAYDTHVTGGAFQAGMSLGGMAMGYGRYGSKEPSNARQAAGAIIALPIGILTIAITAALSLIGLIVKLIDAIIGLISKLIKKLAGRKNTKSDHEKNTNKKINFQHNEDIYFAKNIIMHGIASENALRDLRPFITKMINIDIANKDKSDFDDGDIEKVTKLKNTLEEKANSVTNSKKAYEEAFDKISDSPNGYSKYTYLGDSISELSWDNMTNICKKMDPTIREYLKAMQNYQEKLKKTDAECKKAKAAGEKEVKLNSQAAIATENSNKILKSANSIVKIAADWVKLCSTVAHSTMNAVDKSLSIENYNKIDRSVNNINDDQEYYQAVKYSREGRDASQEEIASINKQVKDALNYGKK